MSETESLKLPATVAAALLLTFVACAPAQPIDDPPEPQVDEVPMVEIEEERLQQMARVHRLEGRMHERQSLMLEHYQRLEGAYDELDQDDALDDDLAALADQVRGAYREQTERHRRMQRHMQEDDRPQMHFDDDDRSRIRRLNQRYREMRQLHEEMAQMNRTAGRPLMGEEHQQLGEHYAQLERLGDRMLEAMPADGEN